VIFNGSLCNVCVLAKCGDILSKYKKMHTCELLTRTIKNLMQIMLNLERTTHTPYVKYVYSIVIDCCSYVQHVPTFSDVLMIYRDCVSPSDYCSMGYVDVVNNSP
jgi:hypothetical protein